MNIATKSITFTLNGETVEITVPVRRTLLDILRENLGLTGTKEGCREGQCGACTVLVNGLAVNSCLILAPDIDGKNITTIEGIEKDGKLSDLQQSFIDEGAVQCGYCIPGMIMVGEYILAHYSEPTKENIKEAISGNLCRCTGYESIIRAIMKTVEKRRRERLKIIGEAVKMKKQKERVK